MIPAKSSISSGGRWLITGASRGLGAALADLAESEFGAEVASIDRSPANADQSRAHVLADLSTAEGRDVALDFIRDWKPTVLVNNAATNHGQKVELTSNDKIDEILEVGFETPYKLMREIAILNRNVTEPVWVINIVSPYRTLGVRTHSLYCATKAALKVAGESLALDTDKVRVVSVSPGAFETQFRPVEENDAWLVKTYRRIRQRTPDQVASALVGRLKRGTRRPHWTLRVGWDGWLFEMIVRVFSGDLFLVATDALIGQRDEKDIPDPDTTDSL